MATNGMNASLELAKRLSDTVNAAWESGELLDQVTPTTQELLKFWFSEEYCSLRNCNFHAGQRQAILNIIYLHEVIGVKNVTEFYQQLTPDLMPVVDLGTLSQQKYQMPKYAVKMATGTGKTWVMHALLIWQVLNARHEDEKSGRFTKNFLIVAPGLIVYDRLLDAFCGRMKRDREERDFETNDFNMNQEVFIPVHYRQEVFSFIQNNVVTKEEGIGRKTTGEGLIALTNWHLFENQIDEESEENDDIPGIINKLLPIRPGKAAGNDLGMLDRRYLRGSELEYLSELDDIMVINDEAHHIHELKRNGEIEEVEWQKGLNAIAEKKGEKFFQVDFSATPYDQKGSGKKAQKCYFPHIVVDFDLATAMRKGLVKTLLLDRRQELTELGNLDYKAVRDDRNKVCDLSDGQRLMLRAGLAKLKKLKVRRITLLQGTSMGAEVALAFARCSDIPVDRCVFDGGPFFDFPDAAKAFMRRRFSGFLKKYKGKTAEDVLKDPLVRWLGGEDARYYRGMIDSFVQSADFITPNTVRNAVETCYACKLPDFSEEEQHRFQFCW